MGGAWLSSCFYIQTRRIENEQLMKFKIRFQKEEEGNSENDFYQKTEYGLYHISARLFSNFALEVQGIVALSK